MAGERGVSFVPRPVAPSSFSFFLPFLPPQLDRPPAEEDRTDLFMIPLSHTSNPNFPSSLPALAASSTAVRPPSVFGNPNAVAFVSTPCVVANVELTKREALVSPEAVKL